MKTIAAVLIKPKEDLKICHLEIPKLKAGQVLVKIHYSGVCGSQLNEIDGLKGPDYYLPHCLGHEASGEVMETGPEVTKVKPDDRVVLSWIAGSGKNVPSTRYKLGSKFVNAGAVTTFMNYAVVSENRVSKLNGKLSFRDGALLGCAIPTAIGSLIHTAKVKKGESAIVFGLGGIGTAVMMAANALKLNPVFGLDCKAQRVLLAKNLDLSNVFLNDSMEQELEKQKINGFDYAFVCAPSVEAMSLSLKYIRPRGGKSIIIGNAPKGQALTLDPGQFNLGKQLLGCWGGDCQPDKDFDSFSKLHLKGDFDFSKLIGKEYSLEKINQAISDLRSGLVLRPLIFTS